MSDSMIEKLSSVDLATLVIIIVVVSTICNFLYPWFVKLKNHIIKKNAEKVHGEEIEKLVQENHRRIARYEDNRIHDREQSFQIQQQLTDCIADLTAKLELLDKGFQEDRERNNKRIRAELKDKISQSYRYHHSIGAWNDIEKESLEGLIEEYEAAGGYNSFVHDVVVPEMYTWQLVPRT